MAIPPYHYHVLFAGQLQPGRQRDEVKRTLAASLRLSAEKADGLFAGKKRVMKRTETLAQAEAFVQVFANAGAIASIETHDGIPVKSENGVQNSEPAFVASANSYQQSGEMLSATVPPFRPFPANWLFKPTLLFVALVESLLTLFYVVTLVAAALLLAYQALLSDWLFELIPSPWLAAPLLALIVMASTLLLALLAKPLLGFISRKEPYFVLNPEIEPEFFNYVGEIAGQVGTAPPVVIRVNHGHQVRVRPLWSWAGITQRQKVLTIGLPLLAGLNSQQFAALLAQALSPWRPGFMRVVGQVLDGNLRWLHRAGYDRDMLDRALLELQRRLPQLATGLEHLIRVASWSALPARARLYLSRLLSRRLYHRLIADSDALARQIAGNEAVASAMQQGRLLGFAAQHTLPALEKMWQEKGTLPDNLAQAVVARASHYPPQTQLQLEQMEERRCAETGGFYPTTAQRIALGNATFEKGTYDLAAPCAAYFLRLEKLMHILTVSYYHSHLQIPVTTNKLTRTPAKGSQEYEANSQIARYFGPVYGDFVPLRLRAQLTNTPGDTAELTRRWQEGVAQLLAGQQKAKLAVSTLAARDEELIDLSNRELLQRSGVASALTGFTLFKGRAIEEFLQQCRDAENDYDAAVTALDTLLKPYVQRLGAALSLLASPSTLQRIPDAPRLYQEAQQLLVVCDKIETNYAKLRDMRLQTILLESLLSYQSIKSTAKLRDRIRELSDDISRAVAAFSVFYKKTPFPFESEEFYENLFDWVLAQAANGEGAAADYDRGNDTVKRMALMQRLIVGRLTTIALQVESQLGLKPQHNNQAA